MPELSDSTYVAEDGTLMWRNSMFDTTHEVQGVKATELWADAYERNLGKGKLLFPAKDCSPFPFSVETHKRERSEFVRKGGGFRLDFERKLEPTDGSYSTGGTP